MKLNFIIFTIFHNQHTYNPSYVVKNEQWSQRDSGIFGSSFIQVPYFLKYFFKDRKHFNGLILIFHSFIGQDRHPIL